MFSRLDTDECVALPLRACLFVLLYFIITRFIRRRLVFGDDDSSSEYGVPSRSVDAAADEDDDNDNMSLMAVDSDNDTPRLSRSDREEQQKKRKRKAPDSNEKSRPANESAPKRQKKQASEIDDNVFTDSQQGTIEAKVSPKKASNQSQPARNLPSSLAIANSSLSPIDSMDDLLSSRAHNSHPLAALCQLTARSEAQPLKPIVPTRKRADDSGAKLLKNLPPSNLSLDDDDPWTDATASEQPGRPAPADPPKKLKKSPSKTSIKREPTVELPEVQVVESTVGGNRKSKRNSVGALSRRSSSGSGEETDDPKPKQLKIDQLFVKSEDTPAAVAARMHEEFVQREAEQVRRVPSNVAMPPPAAPPRVKKSAAAPADNSATNRVEIVSNGPGPVMVGSGLKQHNMVRVHLASFLYVPL